MFSVETAINYLLNRKFGFTAKLLPQLLSLQKIKDVNAETPKELIEIEAFEKALRALPISELEIKYQQSVAQDASQAKQNAIAEEKSRFYNLQSANADFVHWSKATHWTLDESIALSFGKEPEEVNWKKIEPLKNKTVFAKNYAKRRDLAVRATRWKKFGDTIPPVIFISWAKEVKIELPSELIAELANIGCTATNWREQYQKLKLEFDALKNKAPDSTQKTENLLKAIACIAIDAYGYDQNSAKSTAPKDIAEALKRYGISLDPKTIKSWLKDGILLLPRKPA